MIKDPGSRKLNLLIILLIGVAVFLVGRVIYLSEFSLENRVKKVSGSVVSIVATKQVEGLSRIFFAAPSNSDESIEISGGTGFFVSTEGIIVTNAHILSGENYTVITDRGDKFPAQVLKQFPEKDIAFLKIDGDNWPTVVLSTNSGLNQGQRVFSLGNTLGYYANTLHTGTVAAPRRSIEKNGSVFEEMIQLEMNIAQGDSGAPLFNRFGQVVGLITAFDNRASNLAFALPTSQIIDAFNQLNE